MKPIIVLILSLAVGCSSEGDTEVPNVDAGGGEITCTVTATATPNLGARTMSGVGTVQCNATASLRVETCVQWNTGGVFEDIQCMSEGKSGADRLEVTNLSSCGISQGRSFRARVSARVNDNDQAEILSAEVGCELAVVCRATGSGSRVLKV